jgi:hypothetical protein
LILFFLALSQLGCVISEQEGDRGHVNSPHPEEISFHFHTPFNTKMLYGRTVALLGVAFWIFGTRVKGANQIIPIVLAAALVVGALVWLKVGWDKVYAYRIDVRPDRLIVEIPSQPRLEASWQQIEAIEVEGMAYQVGFFPEQEFWSTAWEDLTIEMRGGSTYDVDLRPLSVEQRGTFWRAIKRKAELTEGGTWMSDSY